MKDGRLLGEWASSVQNDVDNLTKQRDAIDSQLQRALKKLNLIRQMQSLEDGDASSLATAEASASGSAAKSTPNSVREMTSKILGDAGRPLHISEIHRQFVERGYPIPGSGTPFNVLAHLVNSKDFVRVARGTYALAGTVPEDTVLPRAARRRRTRRHRRAGSHVTGA